MGTRLFDLDLQLVADLILVIVAIFLFCFVPILIARLVKKFVDKM